MVSSISPFSTGKTVSPSIQSYADTRLSLVSMTECYNKHSMYSEHRTAVSNFLKHGITPLTPNDPYRGRTAPLTSKVAFYIFIQQIQVWNILNMVYTLRFFSSKCSLFHNSNVFGSCIIHILYTGCAKIKKIIPAPNGYTGWTSCTALPHTSQADNVWP